MSERDQFESWCDAQFDESALSETELNWVKGLMYRAWQGSREALKAEQGEDSDLLARAKKLEQEVGDIAERLNQSSDSGFMCVPVADLYELQLKSGSSYCYTASSSEAHGWAKEGYPIREYVLLGRLQDAMNSCPNYPDKLPCPVLLEPGLRFGKGVDTKVMLGALQRRAERNAERDAMTPEQREEEDAAIRSILNLCPIDTTPNKYDALGNGEQK